MDGSFLMLVWIHVSHTPTTGKKTGISDKIWFGTEQLDSRVRTQQTKEKSRQELVLETDVSVVLFSVGGGAKTGFLFSLPSVNLRLLLFTLAATW